MRKRKRLLPIFLLFITIQFALTGLVPSLAFADNGTNVLDIKASSAILVEVTTGKVIYEKNAKQPLPPASMTKMMTEYLILEAIQQGTISWDDVVTTSEYGHFMGKYGGSRVFLANAEKRTVRELFGAMAIYSANDATVMLAEHLSGSETSFVQLMNDKAKEFGMNNTHFLTSTGYPVEDLGEYKPNIEGDHYMSAEDAAILGRRLILDHPELTEFTTVPVTDFRPGTNNKVTMHNWNWLIPGRKYGYEGADGLKTGHTEAAGYCVTATAERNGLRFVSVIMGAESEDKRFQESIKLLDFGFNNYELKELVPASSTITGQEKATVTKGKEIEVEILTQKPYTTIIRKGEESLYEAKVSTDPNLLIAPIKKDQVVGHLTMEYKGNEVYRYLTPEDEQNAAVPMVAAQDVDKASWLRLFFRAIKDMILGIFSGISETVTGWFR